MIFEALQSELISLYFHLLSVKIPKIRGFNLVMEFVGLEKDRTLSILAVSFVCLFVVFFQIGAGPIPPFIATDFFEASLR